MIIRDFVAINEGQVHLRAAGVGNTDVPLVLLHASPSSSKSLEVLIRSLGQTHHVVAPDTLGNGESPAPARTDPDVAYYADAMDRMADALSIDKINLYGTHTGAHIAVEWAIQNPTRVNKLILEGLAYFPSDLRQEFLELYAPPKLPDELGSQFHWAWQFIRDQMIFFPYYRKDADHLRSGGTFDPNTLHELVMDVLNSLDTYHLPYQAVFSHDLATRLPLVTAHTLCLVSEEMHLDAGMALALESLKNADQISINGGLSRSEAIAKFI